MGMVRAGVDLQLAQLLDAQLGPGQHPLDRAANDLFGSPPEDDSPETEALRRGGCPIEGRASSGECRPDVRLIQFSATDLQEDGHDTPDHPPQEGVGPDVDRHELTRPADPDRVNGPNRLPVRRPEGAEVVSADEDRPGPLHRGGVERDPDPERDALAEWAPRPGPDGGAILPGARRVTRVERRGGTPDVANGSVCGEERIERPPQFL